MSTNTILNTLNTISDKLNTAADKITNSKSSANNAENGLNGLGYINNVNDSTTIESSCIPILTDDKRILEVNMEKFESNTEYLKYLHNWFSLIHFGTPILQDGYIDLPLGNIMYKIYSCRSIEDADHILLTLSRHVNEIQNNGYEAQNNRYEIRSLFMGCINYTTNQRNNMEMLKIQSLEAADIYELNHTIELASKGFPYLNLDTLSFKGMLNNHLYRQYYVRGGYNKDVEEFTNKLEVGMSEFSKRVKDVGSTLISDIKASTKTTYTSLDNSTHLDVTEVPKEKVKLHKN